jgi:molybdopterin molybdotransferase
VAGLLTIDEALEQVLARVRPLGAEPVATADAAGRVLAAPAVALTDLPPFPSSAMDGFAVRAADTPGTLPVPVRIAAGRPAERALAPGEAMAIATGGAVPDGADAVVPIERVDDRGDEVEIGVVAAVGENVRPRGGDVRAGDEVLPAGTRVSAAQVGALAAAGLPEVVCGIRPRAVIVTTGTELRRAGEPLAPGEIYESNGSMLAAALTTAGAIVERLDPVADDEATHRAALERGLRADVLVTTGGVSVGPHDLVRTIEAELGVEEVFWGVAMRPGKPLSFGVRERTLVFGLPGNPVSSLVGAELFVRPAVLALQGAAVVRPRWDHGVLAAPARRNPARDELARARIGGGDDGVELTLVSGQESHMIVRAAGADALVLIHRGDGEVGTGERVRYLRLD